MTYDCFPTGIMPYARVENSFMTRKLLILDCNGVMWSSKKAKEPPRPDLPSTTSEGVHYVDGNIIARKCDSRSSFLFALRSLTLQFGHVLESLKLMPWSTQFSTMKNGVNSSSFGISLPQLIREF
jgi:hypothetical protein